MNTEGIEEAMTDATSALRCPLCGHEDIRTTPTVDIFTYGVGENAAQLTAVVPVRTCVKCGYQYTDDEAEDARQEAVCRHLGVLTPAEIVALREKAGLTREALAGLTRSGEALLARWERGAVIQDGPADQLLYLLQFEENVQRLRERAEKEAGQRGPEELSLSSRRLKAGA